MDLVEDRDPAFWFSIFNHPDVKPHMGGLFDIGPVVTHPSVIPLRTEHGGYLLHRLDGLGRVYDLHALYRPEGWGKEACTGLKSALAWIFAAGAQLVTAQEVEGWWKSRPPRSFGFRPAGDFAPSEFGSLRTWVLTKAAWETSPARSRPCRQP